jgi:PAS domain S-box-containing protein
MIRWSKQFEQVVGYTTEEVTTLNALDIIADDSKENVFVAIQHVFAEGQATVESNVVTKSGRQSPYHLAAQRLQINDQLYLVGTGIDLTERKRAEDELKRNVNFTSALLDAIPTPVFYKDKEGRYQGCNRAFTEIMGKTAEEIRGKTVHQLWPSANADIYHQKDIELMQKAEHQVYESTTKDKNGNIRPVIFAKDVFYDEGGKAAGLVGAFIDITEQAGKQALLEPVPQTVMDNIRKASSGKMVT